MGSVTPARILILERDRRLAQVAALEQSFDAMLSASDNSNADDEHDPEGATIAFERSQFAVQIAHAKNSVTEIDHALVRVRDGTYGLCEKCGERISPGRLEARPAAVTCITCAAG